MEVFLTVSANSDSHLKLRKYSPFHILKNVKTGVCCLSHETFLAIYKLKKNWPACVQGFFFFLIYFRLSVKENSKVKAINLSKI